MSDTATSGEANRHEIAHTGETTGSGLAPEGAFGVEQRGMFGVRGSGDTTGFGGLTREPFVAPEARAPLRQLLRRGRRLPRGRLPAISRRPCCASSSTVTS